MNDLRRRTGVHGRGASLARAHRQLEGVVGCAAQVHEARRRTGYHRGRTRSHGDASVGHHRLDGPHVLHVLRRDADLHASCGQRHLRDVACSGDACGGGRDPRQNANDRRRRAGDSTSARGRELYRVVKRARRARELDGGRGEVIGKESRSGLCRRHRRVGGRHDGPGVARDVTIGVQRTRGVERHTHATIGGAGRHNDRW